jgi:hypothetical protein
MLAEDPSNFGLIYVLKFSHNSTYFIWKVSKNTTLGYHICPAISFGLIVVHLCYPYMDQVWSLGPPFWYLGALYCPGYCDDPVAVWQCQGVILDGPGPCSDDPGLFCGYYIDLAQSSCVIHHILTGISRRF